MEVEKQKINSSSWVEEYSDDLFKYAFYRLNDRELSKDFVQETFLSALNAINRFEEKSSIRTWLFSIIKRKIIDHWRQQNVRKTKAVSKHFKNPDELDHSWVLDLSLKESGNEIEKKIFKEELNRELIEGINKLPIKWRNIIIDKYILEKHSELICDEYKISPSNFWVIVHRAKKQLREILEINYY